MSLTASPVSISRTRTASNTSPSLSGTRSRWEAFASADAMMSARRPRRADSQRDRLGEDAVTDARFERVCRDDVDVDTEQCGELSAKTSEGDEPDTAVEVDEQVHVAAFGVVTASCASEH